MEKKFKNILESLDLNKRAFITKAYDFAFNAHLWQKRKSWEPYFIHPLFVACTLWDKFKDIDLCVAWFLHDTVEDNLDLKIEDIYNNFWENVWYIVDSLTKTEKKFLRWNEIFDDERDKMLYWWMKNIWCILVKLADREHNLSTLSHMKPDKQVKKSFESQSLYLPLMHILWFDKSDTSIEKSQELFLNYLQKNNIKSYKELKNNLLNICFNDFSEDLFNIVYNNSTNVVWELEDKDFFDELIVNGWFDNNSVELLSIKWDLDKYFLVQFRVKNWHKFNDLKNIQISKKNFIT